MLTKNFSKILGLLSPSDIVLDIGGWAIPFNRANYVVDINPYETRGIHGSQGQKEFFNKDTWIVQDVCSKPLPFKNKEIDFIVCSHILEDIRDPLYLCSEMIRVGKSGYIEVPSRTFESIKDIHHKNIVGYAHHHWFVEIINKQITFIFKNHMIHSSWKYYLPNSFFGKLNDNQKFSFLFWKDSFSYGEKIIFSDAKYSKEYYDFVKKKKIYPGYYYFVDNIINPYKLIKDVLIRNNSVYRKLIKHKKMLKILEKMTNKGVVDGIREEKFWRNLPNKHSS